MADSAGMNVDDNSAPAAVTPQSLITEDNVRATLTADKGAKARLVAWKVVDFTKEGDNYVCVVSSVEVEYELNGQSSEVTYVAKINPCNNSPFALVTARVLLPKEAKFYLELVPELNRMLKDIGHKELNFPKCFHACLEKGKEVTFMEDLRKRGYIMVDSRRGLDEAHATLVLRELARLNAASILLQNKYPGEDFTEKYQCLKNDWGDLVVEENAFFMEIKKSLEFGHEILRRVKGYERAVAWIDTIIPKLKDIFYNQLKYGEPKVVGHGDLWSNNLLYRYGAAGHPEDVILLDLQMVRYGPPTPDLNYLFYTSLMGDVRKANLQSFLNYYHDSLTEVMEAAGQGAPFTKEQLLKDFRDKNLIGTILATLMVPLVVFKSDDAVDSDESNLSLEEKMTKARVRGLETMDTNPLLKPMMLSVFDEMMEVGIIP